MRTALKSCSIKLLIKRCSRQLRPADISTERIFIKILWSTIYDRTVFWSPRFWNSVYQVPFYFCVFQIIFMLHHVLAEELSLHNLHNFALSFFSELINSKNFSPFWMFLLLFKKNFSFKKWRKLHTLEFRSFENFSITAFGFLGNSDITNI